MIKDSVQFSLQLKAMVPKYWENGRFSSCQAVKRNNGVQLYNIIVDLDKLSDEQIGYDTHILEWLIIRMLNLETHTCHTTAGKSTQFLIF